jgi:two-component system sensor histidine kinase KdpD
MEHGHIYPPEQARAALEHFFRQENLAQLREIALRRTAQEVDEQLDEYMREAAVRSLEMDEHVMVCVDETPASRTLIRRGWRIAQGLKADLLVGYFKRELDEARHAELTKTLELAEDLNARIHAIELTGDDASAIAAFLHEHGVNHIVLPHRKRSAAARLLSRSLADRLMLAVPHLDVHLVAAGE